MRNTRKCRDSSLDWKNLDGSGDEEDFEEEEVEEESDPDWEAQVKKEAE